MAKQKISYNQAYQELNQILVSLESNELANMDEIAAKVKRAALLLTICRKQLHELDSELTKILEEIE